VHGEPGQRFNNSNCTYWTPTVIFFGFDSAFFGIVTVNTPSRYVELSASASTVSGNLMER
jgi:hypothetical protein